MPKEVGGKIFYSREEGEALGLIPSQEELARAEEIFAAFEERGRALPASEGTTPGFGGRFSDDLGGTEFEGWSRDAATNQWYDKEGRQVSYDEHGRRIRADEQFSERPDLQQ
ncbi:hypothetical protein IU449_21990 [Nocardia higoensis]|uniref:Uncharacterized protein n=1 Tax=Nocardia higoensis TaxID=228599 RepID=A0ABS0DFH0_9NOCA|nr:hypothetical protein [Nocardia higoensis]MBF6357181.1 hypothetical protein [Nocardia higoensis]